MTGDLTDLKAFDNQEFADLARKWYPELEDRVAVGKPGEYAHKDPGIYTVANTKSQKVLEI